MIEISQFTEDDMLKYVCSLILIFVVVIFFLTFCPLGACEEVKSLSSHSQCYQVCRGSSRDHLIIFIHTDYGIYPTFLLKDILLCLCPMSTHFVSIMDMQAAVGLPRTHIFTPVGQTNC